MSEEVQPSTAALGALVFIHNYSQPLELLLSWTALDLGTPEDRRVFGETWHCKLPALLVASWFRCLFSESNIGV